MIEIQSGSSQTQQFNGIFAIQAHLEQRSRIEEYVEAKSRDVINFPTSCNSDCLLGRWMVSAGATQGADVGLLDRLCTNCEDFQEAAAQAILLVSMGKSESARGALREGELFAEASERFQEGLAKLHFHQLMQVK